VEKIEELFLQDYTKANFFILKDSVKKKTKQLMQNKAYKKASITNSLPFKTAISKR